MSMQICFAVSQSPAAQASRKRNSGEGPIHAHNRPAARRSILHIRIHLRLHDKDADLIFDDLDELGKFERRPVAVFDENNVRARDQLFEGWNGQSDFVQRRIMINANAQSRKSIGEVMIKLHGIFDRRRVIKRHPAKHAIGAGFLRELHLSVSFSSMKSRATDKNRYALAHRRRW